MSARSIAMRNVSVCLPVCLSDKRVHYDETEERYVRILLPYERLFSLVYTVDIFFE